MKYKIYILFLFAVLHFQLSKAQTALPKIENYTKGELEIKVAPFGLDGNEIKVGSISADGTIHFSWPEIDLKNFKGSEYFISSIKNAIGMTFCNEKQISKNNDSIKTVDTKTLFLYKYGQQVGSIYPATQKEIEDNTGINGHTSLILGSTISWYYSNGSSNFKANCVVQKEWENSYNFKEITTYNIQLKKGWNIVQNTLLEKEDWKNATEHGSLPKKREIKTISSIPINIKWFLKYWANDKLLEIKHQLATQTPITKKQYENWLPKKLGNLKRSSYEIGKKLKRMPTTNNIELLFEKGLKKATVTIVDCANNKNAASMYTLMLDMASSDWKDKTETGYRSASEIDNTRVMIDYNEKEVKTTLSYNTNQRFLIKAEATNIKPEELWSYLKKLEIEKLLP